MKISNNTVVLGYYNTHMMGGCGMEGLYWSQVKGEGFAYKF